MKKIIIGFILGILLCSGIVYGTNSYQSNEVEYSPTDASWEVSNVNEAINSLYGMKQKIDNLKNFKISNIYLVSGGNVGEKSYSHWAKGIYEMTFDVSNNDTVTFGTISLAAGPGSSSKASLVVTLDGGTVSCTSGTVLDVSGKSTLKISLTAFAHGWVDNSNRGASEHYGSALISYLEFS